MDIATAHTLINRQLEGTQCGARTSEGQLHGEAAVYRVVVTWYPSRAQMLKFPKVKFEASGLSWQHVYDKFKEWIDGKQAS